MPPNDWFMYMGDGYSLGWDSNGHISQMELSRHLEQNSPGFTSATFMAVSPMSISSDLVMGFPLNHASLRSVALPI